MIGLFAIRSATGPINNNDTIHHPNYKERSPAQLLSCRWASVRRSQNVEDRIGVSAYAVGKIRASCSSLVTWQTG